MNLDAQKSDPAWKNYTTQIVLEANLVYTDFLRDANNWEDETDPGRYYYSYISLAGKAQTFSHEQARFWLERDEFPTDMSGLKTLLEKHITERAGGNMKTFDYKSAFPNMLVDTCQTFFEITYHPLGLNTYRVPVKHFQPGPGETSPQKNTYGYFGVVRNNVYTLTITSLNGPGSNVVEPGGYIGVNVSITPWFRREFNEDLGYD